MSASLSVIRSAAVDGRLSNPIFRKAQLQKLHDAISQNSSEIQATVTKDTGHSKAEVAAEYWLSIKLIRDAYEALDHEASLKAEYRIANKLNAPDGKEPVGIVVVEAARHAYLFSLLSALVPALAAGNCIIVKVRLVNRAPFDRKCYVVTRERTLTSPSHTG